MKHIKNVKQSYKLLFKGPMKASAPSRPGKPSKNNIKNILFDIKYIGYVIKNRQTHCYIYLSISISISISIYIFIYKHNII